MKRLLLATLRYPRAWMTLGLVIAVLIVIASLTPARDMPVLGISDKLEHAVPTWCSHSGSQASCPAGTTCTCRWHSSRLAVALRSHRA